jgi:type 1 fimbriae regulatory protein FimB/type 1 fimbriae regulatory protein FimE
MLAHLGEAANFPFSVYPHMLRHACGNELANDGHDTRAIQHYLGHKNIQHTAKYTGLCANRFMEFFGGGIEGAEESYFQHLTLPC